MVYYWGLKCCSITLQKIFTMPGSNWDPAQQIISLMAVSGDSAAR